MNEAAFLVPIALVILLPILLIIIRVVVTVRKDRVSGQVSEPISDHLPPIPENEATQAVRKQKTIAKVALVAILALLFAVGISLGIGMGLPWWAIAIVMFVAVLGTGLGMFLGFKAFRQMYDYPP